MKYASDRLWILVHKLRCYYFWFSNGRWLAFVVLKSSEKSWSVWMNEWWSCAVLYCTHHSAVTETQLDYLFSYFLQGGENMKLLPILWKLLVILLDQTVRILRFSCVICVKQISCFSLTSAKSMTTTYSTVLSTVFFSPEVHLKDYAVD